MIVAAVDAGTNTLRLLVKDTGTGRIICKKNYYLFLGEAVGPDGRLDDAGRARLRDALRDVRDVVSASAAVAVLPVATAFARRLGDRGQLQTIFAEELGAELHILSPDDEAGTVLAGMAEHFGVEHFGLIDMGGGSTEFAERSPSGTAVTSFPFGSLSLAGRFFTSYPPDTGMLDSLAGDVRERVSAIAYRPPVWFCAGGTVTTAAFILSGMTEYDPDRINGRAILADELADVVRTIKGLPQDVLRERYRLEQGRERVLLAGVHALATTLGTLGISRITVSDVSLLEGIIALSRRRTASS